MNQSPGCAPTVLSFLTSRDRRAVRGWPRCSTKCETRLQEGADTGGTGDVPRATPGSVAAAAAKVLAANNPESMAVRAYLQLPSLKKAPPEVGTSGCDAAHRRHRKYL